jgi:hypothetical protein
MLRASRRGMVDLIVMIVLIVFLLGMGTLAFLTYDRAQKEGQLVAALHEIPARQQAEIDAVRARFAEVSALIGFRGETGFSSPQAIAALLEAGSELVAEYYFLQGDVTDTRLTGTRAQNVNVRRAGQRESASVLMVNTTSRNDSPLYDTATVQNLQAAIGRVDDMINRLVDVYTPRIAREFEQQGEALQQERARVTRELEEAFQSVDADIENARNSHNDKLGELAREQGALSSARAREADALATLDGPGVREARERAFLAAVEAARARGASLEMQEAYRLQEAKRRLDSSRDPDGVVMAVSERSGYVWINIGQLADVKVNQTFQVLRADTGRAGESAIAEIRVVEVLENNISRCRVDALESQDVYPRQGDMIRNPNFSSVQYESWALVGQFGGQYTRLSRQQLVDALRAAGFRVTDEITPTTDAVIIGGNWADDPAWRRARERRLSFETYNEEDVLWFLGLIGPDRR